MNRFFIDDSNVKEDCIFIYNKEDIKHMTRALRLSIGAQIHLSDKAQWEYTAEIVSISPEQVKTKILQKRPFTSEPKAKITLFQAIPKQGKMETIIQKSVELGVYAIVPVFMERTVVTDKGKLSQKRQRWQKISEEAAKQSGRGIIPTIEQEIKSAAMIQATGDYDLFLVPYENERGQTIKACLQNLSKEPKTVAVAIGPEGGFSEEEIEQLKESSSVCVSLGKTTLRTETAGPAAIAMLLYELEL